MHNKGNRCKILMNGFTLSISVEVVDHRTPNRQAHGIDNVRGAIVLPSHVRTPLFQHSLLSLKG